MERQEREGLRFKSLSLFSPILSFFTSKQRRGAGVNSFELVVMVEELLYLARSLALAIFCTKLSPSLKLR